MTRTDGVHVARRDADARVVRRHRYWTAAWSVWMAAAIVAAVAALHEGAPPPAPLTNAMLLACSGLLTAAAILGRSRLLTRTWLEAGISHGQFSRGPRRARLHDRRTRGLALPWTAASTLAIVGAYAAHCGAARLGAVDLIVAAGVLLLSPPKILADS